MSIYKFLKTTVMKEICYVRADSEKEANDILHSKNLDGQEWKEISSYNLMDSTKIDLFNSEGISIDDEVIIPGIKENEAYILTVKDLINY